MDYENKLLLAKEALDSGSYDKETIEYIFPELKESDDERIRKELIAHCRNTRCVTEEGAERIAKWITWLEKQGRQKYTEMNLDAEEIYTLQSKLLPILTEFASRHLPDGKKLTLNYPFCQIIIKM